MDEDSTTATEGDGRSRLRRFIESYPPRQRVVVGWTIFAVALAIYIVTLGFPYSADVLLLWLTAALGVASLSDLDRWKRGVLRDWGPLYVILLVYALLRGYASHVLWGPFVHPQIVVDRFLGAGHIPTVWLQHELFDPHHLHVWDYLVWCCYMSHFFVTFIVLGVLWKRDHQRFRRYMVLWVSLTLLGYVTYVLYPAVPPWMASQQGSIGPVTRLVPVVWQAVGINGAAAIFTGGNHFDNNIAAMPSLHAAYPMLLCLFFFGRAKPWLKVVLVGYVVAMGFTLVYAGEHFIIDELVGWSYAAVVYFGGSALLDRWTARGAHRWLTGAEAEAPRAAASDPAGP